MSLPKVVLLLSGGLDSAAYLVLLRKHYEIVALAFNYGQKSHELQAAKRLADKYNVPFEVMDLPPALWGETNALMKGAPENPHDPDKEYEVTAKNLVEGRNPIFLMLAAAYASRVDARYVVIGFHQEPVDSPFRDGRTNYFPIFNQLLAYTFKHRVSVVAPYHDVSREGLARRAYRLDRSIFSDTVSCYEETECGRCTHCIKKQILMNSVLSHFQAE